MAGSKIPGLSSTEPLLACMPPRTPGSLGINDSADPNVSALQGDSPGSLGINDGASSVFQVAVGSRLPGSELTCWLPTANPNAPRLSEQDFQAAAAEHGVEVAVIRAVAKVESGGRTGFDDQGRPKILFEAHIFHKFTMGKYDKKFPQLSETTWEKGKKYYSLDQWTRMYAAMDLDQEAAWKSASWGMFQIMGFNHNGFATVRQFVAAMFESEYQHLKSFLAFCADNNLIAALKKKDWAGFARVYNGAGYKQNKYDQKMEQAYKQYSAGEKKEHK
jgi:hypothetical protein